MWDSIPGLWVHDLSQRPTLNPLCHPGIPAPVCLLLSHLCDQSGARTRDTEIKSPPLHQPSQSGAPILPWILTITLPRFSMLCPWPPNPLCVALFWELGAGPCEQVLLRRPAQW